MRRPAPHPPHLRLVEGDAPAQPTSSPEPRWTAADVAPQSAASTAAPASGARGLGGLPDAQLVALGIHGDRGALEALYRKHAGFAIQLATRIEGSARDVEDIAHDAFLKAFARLGELHDRAAFRAWLGSIVVHAVRSRMRRARIMNVLGLGRGGDPVDLDALTSSDASPATRAQLAQIYALLRTMPTDERIAWTLRCVEGHDLETAARMTGCSLATVKRRISRVQRFLEEHFIDPAAPLGTPTAATGSSGVVRSDANSHGRPFDSPTTTTNATNATARDDRASSPSVSPSRVRPLAETPRPTHTSRSGGAKARDGRLDADPDRPAAREKLS